MFGQPHRIGRREGERMLFREEVDPFTGRQTGRRVLDPMVRRMLEQQGYDADVMADYYRQTTETDDPTIIDGVTVPIPAALPEPGE